MGTHKINTEMNSDLVKERVKCDFDIREVTHILDGGEEKTEQRKKLEYIALDSIDWKSNIPEECLNPKERYEEVIRKSCLYSKLMKDQVLQVTGMESYENFFLIRKTADAYFKEVSPLMLHLGMFVPTILGQCTLEQQARWLPRALDFQIIGAYAQTELGHGTFIRGLETTATYDPKTEEFILHSPTLSAYKWWAGGLGHSANYCIVVAQLYTQGKCYGIQPFIVQIRDEETHMPLPGIKVGEIGPKMAYYTADNGFLGFDYHRIPRDHMMMKHAQVLKDGTYVKVARHEKLTYGTMVFVRVHLLTEMAFSLAKAITIATRYSAVRRQGAEKSNEPELQILDYTTQKDKLFICIATAHAVYLTASWMWRTYIQTWSALHKGNTDRLPELHALSSGLKAIITSDAAALVAQCRVACGGHGYLLSSNLPQIYAYVSATITYEGDYTVLLLQTARFLVKERLKADQEAKNSSATECLKNTDIDSKTSWDNTPEGIVRCFKAVSDGKLAASIKRMKNHIERGKTHEEAWQLSTVQLISAAEAYCRGMILKFYWSECIRLTATASLSTKRVMEQLVNLYLLYWTLKKSGDLFIYTTVSEEEIIAVQEKYEDLLEQIRPNAVGLVDAFDIRDEILNSTLGAYDGRVYERLMEEALKSPLNTEPVNNAFHKYLKPLMKGKL